MKRYQKTKASQYIVVGTIIAAIIGSAFISSLVMRQIPFEDHFALPWAAGRAWLLEAVNPYESEIFQLAEDAVLESPYSASLPDEDVLLLPLVNLVFYLPFSLIPYSLSRLIWVTTLSLCVILIGYFSFSLSKWNLSNSLSKVIAILFILLWIPGITTVLLGQLSPIILLLLILSIHLLLQRQDTAAGFILALTAGSFTISGLIIILVVAYGLLNRRWSIISAFFSGVAFIVVISLLLLPSWPGDWLRILIGDYSGFDLIQTPLMTLAGYLPGVESFLSIFLHALFGIYFLYLMITLRGKSERVFIWNTLTTFIIAFLVNIRGSSHFIFLIFPALFLVFRFFSERWGLFGQIISWIIIALMGIGSWLLFLPVESIDSPSGLSLFFIGIALLVFVGMNWIRWWAIKIQKLPFESF